MNHWGKCAQSQIKVNKQQQQNNNGARTGIVQLGTLTFTVT